ncbi:MAG: methyltransferase [Oscillospiraceae bacterium]|nr:methyltransferase [Oscillospiraceae bacterium]
MPAGAACEYESLGNGLYVCRSEIHGFGTDAFLLTGFCNYRAGDTVCDLGTGCGIIPMLMQREKPPHNIYAVDIQPEAIGQLNLGIAKCERPVNITPICADLRELWEGAPVHRLDLVTCNPPYFAESAGFHSQNTAKEMARHEVSCEIGDICAAAAKLLRYHGRFCLCCRPERLTDVMTAMRANNIEPKRLRFVCKTPDSAPWLFLMEGMTHAKPFLRIEPALYMRSGSEMSAEAAALCHFGE